MLKMSSATRQEWRAMQNEADQERSGSKNLNKQHEPPWYEKSVEAMEFDDYVLQPDIQVRWSSKMAGRGRQMAIIDNPTWLKEKKDRGGASQQAERVHSVTKQNQQV